MRMPVNREGDAHERSGRGRRGGARTTIMIAVVALIAALIGGGVAARADDASGGGGEPSTNATTPTSPGSVVGLMLARPATPTPARPGRSFLSSLLCPP